MTASLTGGPEGEARLSELARQVFAPAERVTTAVPTHEVDELLLLSSWFRRFPDELARTVAPSSLAPAVPASAVRAPSIAAAPLLATA